MPRGVSVSGYNSGWFKKGVSTPKTVLHCQRISWALRQAWQTKRKRLPIGSKWIDTGGYVRVKVVAGKGPWKLEHAMVMERKIGRALGKGEVIHHIDGDRQNNTETNLYLCRDHRHHAAVERQLKETFRALLKREVVTFCDALGIYACH